MESEKYICVLKDRNKPNIFTTVRLDHVKNIINYVKWYEYQQYKDVVADEDEPWELKEGDEKDACMHACVHANRHRSPA